MATTLTSSISAAAALALITAWPTLTLAQTSHDTHHPAGEVTTQQSAPPASTQTPETFDQPSTMSDQQGMMGGMSMDRMEMMNTMMRMMSQGGVAGGMPCGFGMAAMDHIEGWLAFLRTELKITDAQTKAWNEFADVMRANTKLGQAPKSMMSEGAGSPKQNLTLPQKLEAQERALAARLERVRAIKFAFEHLSDALSADQKTAAEQLLDPRMGMAGPMMMMPMGGPQL